MKIIAFCDKDTAVGLKLAGVKDTRVPKDDLSDAVNLWNTIEEESHDIGLIIITEELAEHIGQQLNEYRLRNTIPIVVEIPDRIANVITSICLNVFIVLNFKIITKGLINKDLHKRGSKLI